MPEHDSAWVEFDEDNPSASCVLRTWYGAWEKEEGRDFLHRLQFKHVARIDAPDDAQEDEAFWTLEIILAFVIITCVNLPLVLQIFSVLCFRCG